MSDEEQVSSDYLNAQMKMKFIEGWIWAQERAHDNAVAHGFWKDGGHRNQGEAIALMHSELSEALEAMRKGNRVSEHIADYTEVEEELADLVIRVMDLAGGCGFMVAGAIVEKMRFNEWRSFRHGKEF